MQLSRKELEKGWGQDYKYSLNFHIAHVHTLKSMLGSMHLIIEHSRVVV